MRSWIILGVVALGICFCGLLIAQEQPPESPATTSEAVTTDEGASSGATTATAGGAVKPGADTSAPVKTSDVSIEEKAPVKEIKENIEKAPVKPPVTE